MTIFNGNVNSVWQAWRTKPAPSPDGGFACAPVVDLYGNVKPSPLSVDYMSADEGSEFMAYTPTPLTAITSGICATDLAAQVKPFILLQNQSSGAAGSGAVRFYLRYIRIIQGATVPANATNWHFTAWVDSIVNKYTSGGTQYTPVSTNPDSPTQTKAVFYAGNVVSLAAGVNQGRRLFHATAGSVIPVIGQEWVIEFGQSFAASVVNNSAAPIQVPIRAPAVVVGPGQNFTLNMFGASSLTTGGNFEVECVWMER